MSALNQGFRPPDATIDLRRSSHDQSEWAVEVKKYYQVHEDTPKLDDTPTNDHPPVEGRSKQVSDSNDKSEEAKKEKTRWCPILKTFIPESKGVTAHIVSYATGQAMAKKIFAGEKTGKDILFDCRNGLWMTKNVEKAMDQGYVILVPSHTEVLDFEASTYDIKLLVLNQELLKKGKDMIVSFKLSNEETKTYYWGDVNEISVFQLSLRNMPEP